MIGIPRYAVGHIETIKVQGSQIELRAAAADNFTNILFL